LYTQPLEEKTPPPSDGQGRDTGLLEKALAREQKTNESLATAFDKADEVVTRLKEAIATGQEKQLDVSALEDALKELNGQISAARAAHDRAARLLATPAGFGKDGLVIDRQLALETVGKIHRAQQVARQLLGDSIKDALKAVREYRQDNAVE